VPGKEKDRLGNAGFSPEESRRYSRHVLLEEIGWTGQQKFKAAKVLVVGAGGLGSASLFYLAAAGVGEIGLVDGDAVEVSNLQRQILHGVEDLERRKVDSARDSLRKLNPHCRVQTFDLWLNGTKVSEILRGYDVVLDASDNFPTRFQVADCCWQEKIPLVSAAVAEFSGQLLVVDPRRESPCYRCLLPEPPPAEGPSEQPFGILGAVAGVMGSLQAVETLTLLLGRNSALDHQLLSYDALRSRFHLLPREKNPACPLCGEN
jgi:molybdopterin/thiamine biosynthesis adenylyltransferase